MFTQRRMAFSSRILIFFTTILAMFSASVGGTSAMGKKTNANAQAGILDNYAIVFVSRKIPGNGSVYYNATGSLPGVMPYSRFQVAAPGKLIVREANGTLRILIDGSNPNASSLNLIDVNAPSVSYDATKIVFAGLTAGTYDPGPLNNPGAWRIYIINVDGTGLRQVTSSDQDNLNLSQFKDNASLFTKYDDTDPVWLPDGRIAFSSTRWPSFGQYGGVRTSNLYVVDQNGTGLHRITAERNGADRPQVDPLTGKIVYSRWWRNFRLGVNSLETKLDPIKGGYIMKDGLLTTIHADTIPEVGGFKNLERNAWHLATINPDGTGLAQWAGRSNTTFYGQIINHAYGGAFASDGSFYANFFPMANGSEAAGFGGIRHYQRGPKGYKAIIGITTRDESVQQFVHTNPNSYGIYVGNYAAEPEVLPDGSLIISWAKDVAQDYGLYTINPDGSNLIKLYDNPGTTELRTRVIRPRPVPPVIPDKVTKAAGLLPPLAEGPYDIDGTFTFQALNVYFNAPVDVDIISAIPVGSANSIRFFIDHQRWQQNGSIESLDWPILLQELPVNPDGSMTASSPANVPLFEQIRSRQPDYTVPLTGQIEYSPGEMTGAAHVAGMNFGRPNEVQRCVGCHAGHTMIPIPANPADAQWTNLAPGAVLSVSSLSSSLPNSNGLIDRRVKMPMKQNSPPKYWFSNTGQDPNSQWVQLTFPVPITVRTVRLHGIPGSDSQIQVLDTTVRLYSDPAGTIEVANNKSGIVSENGTDVLFNSVLARVVRIEFTSVNGTTAGLGEVEVIARGESVSAVGTPASPTATFTPTIMATSTPTSTVTVVPTNTSTATATQIQMNTSVPTSTAAFTPIFTPTNTATLNPTQTALQIVPTLSSDALPSFITPASITSKNGTTNGSLASLSLIQQNGIDDNPDAYVTFQTPDSAYNGYQSFHLPNGIQLSQISAMTLQVNYKGLASSSQTWIWSVYDWDNSKWVKIGKTMSRNSNEKWQMLQFVISNFKRYVSSGNEIRIQLRSDNAKGDAKIDYEVIQLTYVAAIPSLINAAPAISATSTGIVIVSTPTDTPTEISTATPTP